jgi:hypothetical protein
MDQLFDELSDKCWLIDGPAIRWLSAFLIKRLINPAIIGAGG